MEEDQSFGSRETQGIHGFLPHVLIFPFPAQGHINSMLNLAEVLCTDSLHVTFLNSSYNEDRLRRFSTVHNRFDQWPNFRFASIPDGLSEDCMRSSKNILDLIDWLNKNAKDFLSELIFPGSSVDSDWPPVTCIILDGILTSVMDALNEFRIPIICFRTISACCLWTNFCLPKLIDAGEFPFPENNGDLDTEIKSVPGTEGFLRRRDLPSFCRVKSVNDPIIQAIIFHTQNSVKASGFILNTMEDLEGSILSHIRQHFPNVYTLGPLHALRRLISRDKLNSSSSSSSLWREDKSCMSWLDTQSTRSVIYVSFGSYTIMTIDELTEIWHGLVNSRKPFLWVIRPDSVEGLFDIRSLRSEQAFLVEWVPQNEVLNHRAVAAFFTHSGWNSTLESLCAGIPMLCWPFFADQQVNSRFVSEIWKVGLDMKDDCKRETVEKMILELTEGERSAEFQKSAANWAKIVHQAVSEDGSSRCNLHRLIEDITSYKL